MNWFDIVLLIILGTSVLVGYKVGLLGAFFNIAGLVVGVFLAGHLSDDIAEMLTESVSNDTIATVIGYAAIVIGTFVAAQTIRGIIKRLLNLVFLGWVDSVGGLFLGLATGVILIGALLTVVVRYSADIPSNGIVDIIIDSNQIRDSVNNTLIQSNVVRIYLDTIKSIPADTLGFVPSDFKAATDFLEYRIDLAESERN